MAKDIKEWSDRGRSTLQLIKAKILLPRESGQWTSGCSHGLFLLIFPLLEEVSHFLISSHVIFFFLTGFTSLILGYSVCLKLHPLTCSGFVHASRLENALMKNPLTNVTYCLSRLDLFSLCLLLVTPQYFKTVQISSLLPVDDQAILSLTEAGISLVFIYKIKIFF